MARQPRRTRPSPPGGPVSTGPERHLDRRPGEAVRADAGRHLDQRPREPGWQPAPEAGVHPHAADLPRALLYGGAAVGIVALVWLLAGGAVGLTAGLIAVAIASGWLIGAAAASGARRNRELPLADRRVRPLAVALGVLAWVLGTYLAYLWKLAAAADPTLPLARRLADQAFLEWLPGQFSPVEAVQILAIAFCAWRAAR